MKISLNWLKDYITLDLPVEKVAEILTEIGLEVEGVERVESVKGGLEGIVVGLVTKCEKHPNADRLSLTEVNVGQNESLQIVCGAPNVGEGQKVLVAPVGTTLYDQNQKPWKIKKGKIRGEASEGMICAEDEVGLGNEHDGIMILPPEVEVGTLAKDHYEISRDTVFEIGLTPNRSDATCHLGVARDLKAALQINYPDANTDIRLPDSGAWVVDQQDDKIVSVSVEDKEACPRYSGVTIQGIEVKESPQWLKDRLTVIGVRPINNIVDVTNYVLHEMGQPLHAFDLAHIGDHQIVVKTLPANTDFVTLDEQTRKLAGTDLIICDGNNNGLCIAGVFGGIGSGVTEHTKNIFLESAHFDAKWIRRTSGRHLLFTDAAKVFEKGSDPNVCVDALMRAANLIKEVAGGTIASPIVDVYPDPVKANHIKLTYHKLNRLIGVDLDVEIVHAILQALEIEIISADEGGLTASVPTNKSDVTREADLIEEILRIYGFNNVPFPDGMNLKINVSEKLDPMAVQNRVADYLVAQGFHEMMGLSMLDKKYFTESDQFVRINNTSNLNIEVMRPNMLISALETVSHNNNRQQTSLRLFEFGHTYVKEDANYLERQKLAITVSGWQSETWIGEKINGDDQYYALKSICEGILVLLGINGYRITRSNHSDLRWGISYQIGNQSVLDMGKVKPASIQRMEVKSPVFFACFDWEKILMAIKKDEVQVAEISRFPTIRRDLALIVEEQVEFLKIEKVVSLAAGALVQAIQLFDIYRDDSLGSGKKSYAMALTFSDKEKTLSDKEIDSVVSKILKRLEEEVGAQLR